jgi:two-component system, OmpR family, phosphate regulon response regulator PhoB
MKTILIVDDEIDVRNLLAQTLKREDCEILTAETGQEALDIAEDKAPDVILMDIMMPGNMNGVQATRILKTNAKTKRSKIIILTCSDDTKEEAMNAGADGYLLKPFSPLELLETIEGIIV